MKKYLIVLVFIILLIFLFTGCSKDEVSKLYYDDGTIKYEGQFKKGEPYGYGKAFDETGVLFYEGNFKDGTFDQNGYTKTYWSNGNLMFEGILENGERLEGDVYNEDGTYLGYLAYPKISILGTWIGMDMSGIDDETYELVFNEDNSFESFENSKLKGTYEIENYDRDTGKADIILKTKGDDYTGGTITFQNKNLFIITNELGDVLMFIREGTDGY